MHIYESSTGKSLPSVTYLLDKTQSLNEIIRWQKIKEKKLIDKQWTSEDWEANAMAARERGTMVHSYAEESLLVQSTAKLITDTDLQLFSQLRNSDNYWIDSVVKDYAQSFDSFLEQLRTSVPDWSLIVTEQAVKHEDMGYGGTLDFIIRIGNQNHLVDIKTFAGYFHQGKQRMIYTWDKWRKANWLTLKDAKGKIRKDSNGKPMKTKEAMPPEQERDWSWVSHWVKDKYLQLCLYTLAARASGIKVDCASILLLTPMGYQMIRVPASAWSECKLEAQARVHQFWQTDGDRWQAEVAAVKAN